MKRAVSLIVVLGGCLCIYSLVLLILLSLFQSPWGVITSAELVQLKSDIWHYLLFNSNELLIGHEQLDREEERHLLDVKRFVNRLFSAAVLFVLVFSVGFYVSRANWKGSVKGVAVLGLSLLSLVVLSIGLAGFNSSFIMFHELLFVENTWWFDKESALIRLFPALYFKQFAVIYFMTAFIIFSALYVASRR